MGILESVKQGIEELTGAAQRKREQKATQKIRVDSEPTHNQQSQVRKVAERAEAQRFKQERERGGPAERLAARTLPEAQHQMRNERTQAAHPEPDRQREASGEEAERMKYQPTGLQRAPSPGGPSFNYVNTLAHKAVVTLEQEHSKSPSATRETTPIERVQERLNAPRPDQQTLSQKQAIEQRTQSSNREMER